MSAEASPHKLMTVSEVAAALAVSRPMIYVLMDKGHLPWISVGTRRRIRSSDVEAYLLANSHGEPLAPPPPIIR